MSDSYRENYMESLRTELVALVERQLSPVALRYGYSEVPLESNIKWRPQVLVLGNYSSGKSTLINELVGAEIQATGQAPTDDSFTVITHADDDSGGPVRLTEERDGQTLVSDGQYPFAALRRHGQRFTAHFRMKKVNSPFLKHLAIIDTPGMLDSIAERDRGYNYQDVIGDLAGIADLVLVLFDPHKAGTVREAYASLRETLPAKTFEDRVVFVLNRIDECQNLNDLLRVYGTLCWNLSQMLGRKDIPPIRMTYTPGAAPAGLPDYLRFLDNQREDLKRQIASAPKYRLDHLVTYVETHGERLGHFLEALLSYHRRRRAHRFKSWAVGALAGLVAGGIAALAISGMHALGGDPNMVAAVGIGTALGIVALWIAVVTPALGRALHGRLLKDLDGLTELKSQSRRDSWQSVRELTLNHLQKTGGKVAAGEVKAELAQVRKASDKASREMRQALNELTTVKHT